MRKRWALVVGTMAAAASAGMLGGCDEPAAPGGQPTRMSPSDLPTMKQPSVPPTLPTDVPPSGVVAGTVTAIPDGCTEVTTDDAVVWSLSGEPGVALEIGDTVLVKIAELERGQEPCGPGLEGRIVSITVVGR